MPNTVPLKSLFTIAAEPAEACSTNAVLPPFWLVMLAVPALVRAKKPIKPPSLTMVARPAVAVSEPPPFGSPKYSWPLLVMAIELAELALRNSVVPEKAFRSEVTPDVSALTTLKRPSLVTAPTMLAVCVASPSCRDPQLQMNVPPA
ncbi:hypothetical protein ABIA45_006018 [Bradyrhizobium sp. USDA 336]